jgi:hypothetical protein
MSEPCPRAHCSGDGSSGSILNLAEQHLQLNSTAPSPACAAAGPRPAIAASSVAEDGCVVPANGG